MIASLPMYERAETSAAHDRFWALVRDKLREMGIEAPGQLSRGRDPWADWLDPEMVFSQTCGLPFRTRLWQRVALIGTPDYGLPGAPPGHYYSVFIVRQDDTRPAVQDFAAAPFACNDPLSQSGWAAAAAHAAARGFEFSQVVRTGAHLASARAVAAGQADCAALDAVTWRLLQRYEPALSASLRALEHTAPTPGLPFITAQTGHAETIARATQAAIPELARGDRDVLGLQGLVRIPDQSYRAVFTPDPPEIRSIVAVSDGFS